MSDEGVEQSCRGVRLMNADVEQGRKCRDGIARSPWPIELHAGAKPKVEWLLNDTYEAPYGCFLPERGDGLLAAGSRFHTGPRRCNAAVIAVG